MILPKILLHYVILLVMAGVASFIPNHAIAQCSGAPLQAQSYSYSFSGTGNDIFSVDVPQLDLSACVGCTVQSVVIKSYITINVTIEIENTNTVNPANNVKPTMSRADWLYSSVFPAGEIDNAKNILYGPYTLAPSDGIPNSGPDYKKIGPVVSLNNYLILNDSIMGAVAPFQGSGTVHFDYSPITNFGTPSGVNSTPLANDAITFSVIYHYCPPVVLATNILEFSATLQHNQTVKLNWTTSNELTGRMYEIEVSSDGSAFTRFASRQAGTQGVNASYNYDYPVSPGTKGKLWFRLRLIEPSGATSITPVRSVDLGNTSSTSFSLYPNPPDEFVNLNFPSSANWQVDIISSDGSLIQRNYYHNTGAIQLNFQRRLAAGAYFVRATDQDSFKNYVSSFVIRN